MVVAETPTAALILGRDFLLAHECTIEIAREKNGNILYVKSCGIRLPILKTRYETPPSLDVELQESVRVPSCSKLEILGTLPAPATQKTWLVNGKPSGVMVVRALVEPKACSIPLCLLNTHDHEVVLRTRAHL